MEQGQEQPFFSALQLRSYKANSLLCIGLDPHVKQLPSPTPEAAEGFCINIINQSHHCAAAFKPNSAFFECFGSAGFDALKRVIDAIPADIPVILDCKRGDIDTTAQAYATAAYDVFGADSVTLSPYMGFDSIKPFVSDKYTNKGAFLLCKTSNSSSSDMQEERLLNGDLVYEKVVKLCNKWNQESMEHSLSVDGQVGVVVGATDLKALKAVRELAPDIWILCPGVGAQGGAAPDVCEVGLRARDQSGLLVSVSRGISSAPNIKEAAETLRDEINLIRANIRTKQATSGSTSKESIQPYQKEFIDFAISQNVLQFGKFTLKSGRISPYFFNAGRFSSGEALMVLSRSYAKAIRRAGLKFDVIFGPAYKGIPLASCIGMAWFELYGESVGVAYNRKEAKDHGEGGSLVGASMVNRKVLIVDDVITAGTAIREAVAMLQGVGATVVAVTVCLDRQEKGAEDSTESAIQMVEKDFGFPVVAIVNLSHLIAYVKESATTKESTEDEGSLPDLQDIEEYRAKYGV